MTLPDPVRLEASIRSRIEWLTDEYAHGDRVVRGARIVRLRRELAYRRLLARLAAAQPDGWYLKGGLALQLRLEPSRATIDIDIGLVEGLGLAEAEAALREAVALDLGDRFAFEADQSRQAGDDQALTIPITAYIGAARFEDFRVDLAPPRIGTPVESAELKFTALGIPELDEHPPIAVIGLAQQIAEKTCAMFERRGNVHSSRARDLADIATIAQQISGIDASAIIAALRSETERRSDTLPDGLPTAFALDQAQADEWRRRWSTLVRQPPVDFDEALQTCASFLSLVLDTSAAGHSWSCEHRLWEEAFRADASLEPGSPGPPAFRSETRVARSAMRVCVFAPAPILTVTIERAAHDDETHGGELHIHPGGQGFWVARMLQTLGASVTFCSALGGETGDVYGHLLASSGIDVRVVAVTEPSGAYVHDRREGEREEWWHATLGPLRRHEVDDLYSVTLAAALEAGICVLTGTHRQDSVLPDGTFARLAADLRANGVAVVADLQGEFLREVLAGGADLVKISGDELVEDGWASGQEDADVSAGIERLAEAGAVDVVVSRAAGGAMALLDGKLLTASGPVMTAVDPAGAGDSMTAALAWARAAGKPAVEALSHAVAAGAMNVTRHGLGSGDAEAIAMLAENVQIEELERSRQ